MPEGDSIYKLAAHLRPILEGGEVKEFSAQRIADDLTRSLIGHKITKVEAQGKNLLVRFDDDHVLHIHLKMEGRMFVEKPRSAFWKPLPPVRHPEFRLTVGARTILGKNLGICRLSKRVELDLGPDLLTDEGPVDIEGALGRLRKVRGEIAPALLLQHAVAGIGNVYKSEVLFLEKIDPRREVHTVTDEQLRAVLVRSADLLRKNVGRGPRTTRNSLRGARLWVYGRGSRVCLRCSKGTVTRIMQDMRSTYFCPECQS